MSFMTRLFLVACFVAVCVGTGLLYGAAVYLLGGKGLLVDAAAVYGTVTAAGKLIGDYSRAMGDE